MEGKLRRVISRTAISIGLLGIPLGLIGTCINQDLYSNIPQEVKEARYLESKVSRVDNLSIEENKKYEHIMSRPFIRERIITVESYMRGYLYSLALITGSGLLFTGGVLLDRRKNKSQNQKQVITPLKQNL